MLGHNSPTLCCMALVFVSKDSSFKELSNSMLYFKPDTSNSYDSKEGVSNFVVFHDLPANGLLRTFFLSMRTYQGNKIS